MVTHADLHSEYQYGDADVEMMEVPLPAGLIGKRPGDLEVPGEIAVGTILRHGKGILPEPGTTFEKDDTLYVNVLRESAEKLERLLGFRE